MATQANVCEDQASLGKIPKVSQLCRIHMRFSSRLLLITEAVLLHECYSGLVGECSTV